MTWFRAVLFLTVSGTAFTLGCNGREADDRAAASASEGRTTASSVVTDAAFVWESDYDAALAAAKKRDTLIVADFFATWCGPCKAMDARTFTDADVQHRMADFVALKVDVDEQTELSRRFAVTAMPTTLVLDAQGTVVKRHVGFVDAQAYLTLLDETGRRHDHQH